MRNVTPSPDLDVVETATGRVRWRLAGCKFAPRVVKFSPDGRTLAAASTYGEVCVWDLASGALVFRAEDAEAGQSSALWFPLAFSPDSHTLAVGNLMFARRSRTDAEAGIVSLWDVRTGKRRATIRTAKYETEAELVFVGHGRRLRVTSFGTQDYDPSTGKPFPQRRPSSIHTMSEDGRLGFSGWPDWLSVENLDTSATLFRIPDAPLTGSSVSERVVFSPDDRKIAILRSHMVVATGGDTGYEVTAFEMRGLPSGRVLWSLPESTRAPAPLFAPDGRFVLISNRELRDSATGKVVRRFGPGDLPILGSGGRVKLAHTAEQGRITERPTIF